MIKRTKPRGFLRFLFILYQVIRAALILALVLALAACAVLWHKYKSGMEGMQQEVTLELPEATSLYIPPEDDPYFALYGIDPLADTPAPALTPAPTQTPEAMPVLAPEVTLTAETDTAPDITAAAVVTQTPTPTPAPTPEPTEAPDEGALWTGEFQKEIVYEGSTYIYNEDVMTLLVMGIDEEGKVEVRSEGFGKGSQTDVILLTAIDADAHKVTLINISRDTMTEVEILNYDHTCVMGRRVMQLSLSHSYGDGAHISCRAAAKAVSKLLGGLPVNAYAAINYGAVPLINDRVGGVDVTLAEDMTISDVDYKAGTTVHLMGGMSESYVRNREIGAMTNTERMSRQEQYMNGFIAACLESDESKTNLVKELYEVCDGYIVTSLTQDEIVYLGATALSGDWTVELRDVEGTLELGEIYEFYPDRDALTKLLLDVFYTIAK